MNRLSYTYEEGEQCIAKPLSIFNAEFELTPGEKLQ